MARDTHVLTFPSGLTAKGDGMPELQIYGINFGGGVTLQFFKLWYPN
jgi:hypothetical protein